MKRRVYQNAYGIIYLDSDMFGPRKRLSTEQKYSERWAKYYESNFDREYTTLYERKTGKKTTCSLTLQEYGSEVLEATRKQRTAKSQKRSIGILDEIVSYFESRYGPEFEVEDISKMRCAKWQGDMLDLYAEKTVKNKRSILFLVLDYAVDDGIIPRNPLTRLESPKRPKDVGKTEMQEKREPVYWSLEDATSIIESMDGSDRNLCEFAAFSGLRGGEIIGLRWENVDFAGDNVKVYEAIADGEVSTPKSGEERIVDLTPRAKEALLRQYRITGGRQTLPMPRQDPELARKEKGDYVFVTKDRYRFRAPRRISERVSKTCERIGVEVGGLHDFRRFYNTLLHQLGYQQAYIMQQIGHKSEHVNNEHYTGHIVNQVADFERRIEGLKK